jgi:hypothetical protein
VRKGQYRDDKRENQSGADNVFHGNIATFLNPTLADEPGLDDLRQPHIADQRQQQQRPIEGRQGNKPE